MESNGESESCHQAKQDEKKHIYMKTQIEDLFDKLSTTRELNSTSVNTVNVANKHDELIHFNPDDVNGKDVAMENLEHCEIFMKGIPSSLHIKNLHGCVIIVGPCSRSVDIDECHQCEFALACQQLHCYRCRFAPYNVEYQSKQHDIAQSGLVWAVDYWDDVLDFNHKTPDVHSPNWETIEEEERKGWSLDVPSSFS
ncbi:unnamed protein product [Rotaria sp. Silwood1]|nr:unnamed protein product [Rotaria sp. Silwood1]